MALAAAVATAVGLPRRLIMPKEAHRLEALSVHGVIDRAGRFIPGLCGSSFHVRRWPEATDDEYMIELLDREGHPVHRVPARVVPAINCDPSDPKYFRVTAYIGLRADAATVQLRRGDLVLWRREIPDAPSVDVRLEQRRPLRKQPARFRVRFSTPGEGAYMQVMYRWGERRFRSVDIVSPSESMEIDLRALPGGRACRFVVIYSNGLRSAVATSREFRMDPLGPSLTILHPRPRAVLTTGQPLILQGQVIDPERIGGARLQDQLIWIVDGAEVARGALTNVDRLAPGRHRVVLRYSHEPGAEAAVVVTVRRAAVPTADEWEPWDSWDQLGRSVPPRPR
jgi:hypothetical protein